MTARVAVIAGNPQLLDRARDLGVRTVFVQHPDRLDESVAARADVVELVDYTDPGVLTDTLASHHARAPFGRVLSTTEDGLVPAAVATDHLGLPGNGARTVRLLKDKAAMRAACNAAGLSLVRARRVDSAGSLAGFVAEVGGPVVVKPVDGTGSFAVHRVAGADQAPQVFRRMVEAGVDGVLAEEFLDGVEVSVEAFSHGGRHTIFTVTDKVTLDNFVEVGHRMPSGLPERERAAVSQLVRDFLDLVGLREGPSHTEVKLTAAGPRIVESHNRIGGDKIRELVGRVYGTDLAGLTVGVPLGLLPAPQTPPPARGGAAIRFLTATPGVVRRIAVPEAGADCVVHLDVAVGHTVRRLRSSHDRAGYVLASGPDPAAAARRCAELAALVCIETTVDGDR